MLNRTLRVILAATLMAASAIAGASEEALMNPNTNRVWTNPAVYVDAATALADAATGTNRFDTSAWTNMFQPAPRASLEKDEG